MPQKLKGAYTPSLAERTSRNMFFVSTLIELCIMHALNLRFMMQAGLRKKWVSVLLGSFQKSPSVAQWKVSGSIYPHKHHVLAYAIP